MQTGVCHYQLIMRKTLLIFGMIILSYLSLISLFGTDIILLSEDGSSYNYFLDDNVLRHLVFLAILLIVSVVLGKTVLRFSLRKLILIWFLIVFIIGTWVIFTLELPPANDSYDIMAAARGILTGDFAMFEKNGYMYRYPDQRGMVILCIVFIRVFGDNCCLWLQEMNLIMVIGIVCELAFLCRLFFNSRKVIASVLIFLFSFIPLYMYALLVYGTIGGIFFSLACVILCIIAKKKEKAFFYLPAALCMAFAYQIKANSLIWLIGIVIILLWSGISSFVSKSHKTGLSSIVAIFVIVFMCVVSSIASGAVMERLTGIELSKGMPKSAWIYMGLMDNEDAPGAYNGHSVQLFEENDYDYKKTDAAAKENIVEICGYIVHNPVKSVRQFAKKISYQWNNPTFMCINNLESMSSLLNKNDLPGWFRSLIAGGGKRFITSWMNIVQTWILLFALMGIIVLFRSETGIWQILPCLIFIGGFAFHFFWEAKPQYTLPYFILLLPYAACGLSASVEGVGKLRMLISKKSKSDKIRLRKKISLVVIIMAALVVFRFTGVFRTTIEMRSSDERVEQFIDIEGNLP